MSEQKLTLKFIFGTPENIHKIFLIQVAHFEPDIIHLYGEGLFPRITLDLPHMIDESGHYYTLLEKAMAAKVKEAELQETKLRELEKERQQTIPDKTRRVMNTGTQTVAFLEKQVHHKELQVSESLTKATFCKEVQTSESLVLTGKTMAAQTTDSLASGVQIKKVSQYRKALALLRVTGKLATHNKGSQTLDSHLKDTGPKVTVDEAAQTLDLPLNDASSKTLQESSQHAAVAKSGGFTWDATAGTRQYVGSFKVRFRHLKIWI